MAEDIDDSIYTYVVDEFRTTRICNVVDEFRTTRICNECKSGFGFVEGQETSTCKKTLQEFMLCISDECRQLVDHGQDSSFRKKQNFSSCPFVNRGHNAANNISEDIIHDYFMLCISDECRRLVDHGQDSSFRKKQNFSSCPFVNRDHNAANNILENFIAGPNGRPEELKRGKKKLQVKAFCLRPKE